MSFRIDQANIGGIPAGQNRSVPSVFPLAAARNATCLLSLQLQSPNSYCTRECCKFRLLIAFAMSVFSCCCVLYCVFEHLTLCAEIYYINTIAFLSLVRVATSFSTKIAYSGNVENYYPQLFFSVLY